MDLEDFDLQCIVQMEMPSRTCRYVMLMQSGMAFSMASMPYIPTNFPFLVSTRSGASRSLRKEYRTLDRAGKGSGR